jgi:predicted acylesterase/phospholipase RssA
MGGGTSQGTFSGVALTEALKLLVLHGDGGKPPDSIEIDAVSGASAGSLTLAILLRTLLTPRSSAEDEAISRQVDALHPDAVRLAPLGSAARDRLLAAQAAQNKQRQLWAQQAHVEALLTDHGGDRKHDPGLLARRLLDDLARQFLVTPEVDLGKRQLLGDRTVLCCTLANLSPIATRTAPRTAADASGGLAALADAVTSKGHRDLRLFDISYTPLPSRPSSGIHPKRWVPCHGGSERSAGNPGARGTLDIRSPSAWAHIAATAIASGAFPFGFAPVPLTRWWWEYGRALWPFDRNEVPTQVFAYVDGGTFNNEPLRETLRLASFLDSAGGDAERVVLFVDPNLSSLDPTIDCQVPILRRFGDNGEPLPTFARLAAHAGTMLSALRSEASVSESNRSHDVQDLFAVRAEKRAILEQSLPADEGPLQGPPAAALRALVDSCTKRLEGRGDEASLPPSLLDIEAELERVIREESSLAPLAGRVAGFVARKDPARDPMASRWLLALHYLSLDLAMGLEGKRPATIVPLVPMWEPADPKSVFDLPNESVGTFAGFMSGTAQCFTLAAGRHCATRFMVACGQVPPSVPVPDRPTWDADRERLFQDEVRAGLEPLLRRIDEVLGDAGIVPLLGGLVAKEVVSRMRKGILAGLETRTERRCAFELRLKLPWATFRLVHSEAGKDPIVRTRIGASDWLVCHRLHAWRKSTGAPLGWTPPARLALLEETAGVFCHVSLPPADLVEQARTLINPVFEAEISKADGPHHRMAKPRTVSPTWTLRNGLEPLEAALLDGSVPYTPLKRLPC